MQRTIRNITVRGARQHNLKGINVEIPRNKLTVITGLSGSGKSSLAFDTIYAEGQRRYVESLSAYARQFLDRLEPPDVDSIEGLSPAISIEQKTATRSPRSTVGTVTEIYDYLRLLFSSIGLPHCSQCGKPISKQTPDQIMRHLKSLPEGERVMILRRLSVVEKASSRNSCRLSRKPDMSVAASTASFTIWMNRSSSIGRRTTLSRSSWIDC